MQNIMPNSGLGVTQFNGMKPRSTINIAGTDWILRRDATDSSTTFPHQKVNWMNAGCEPLQEIRAYYCWIRGIIAPTPGSIERPINVMYVGFHPQKITIAPNMITPNDLDRMHVYVSDGSDFAGSFIEKFLGISSAQAVEEREHISPWPPVSEDAMPPAASTSVKVINKDPVNDKQ